MTAEQTVNTSLNLGEWNERIQAAQMVAALKRMDPVAFAEYVGDLLMTGDVKLCQSAMLQIKMRRGEG